MTHVSAQLPTPANDPHPRRSGRPGRSRVAVILAATALATAGLTGCGDQTSGDDGAVSQLGRSVASAAASALAQARGEFTKAVETAQQAVEALPENLQAAASGALTEAQRAATDASTALQELSDPLTADQRADLERLRAELAAAEQRLRDAVAAAPEVGTVLGPVREEVQQMADEVSKALG